MDTRIMLVENDAAVRAMLRVTVRVHRVGQVVAETETSEEANRLAAHERPDLVILDLMLDDASGPAVFEGIRTASPSSRVVIFTAHDSHRQWYEEQGAVFVAKTSNTDRLVRALRMN
jgi:DNA-binding NarL/FixJ family response regulator